MSEDARARKAALRGEYAARRAARSAAEKQRLDSLLLRRARACDAATIAAFVPVRGEPGSLEVLDELARRARVLLPVTGPLGRRLEWAAYAGVEHLVPGPLGLLQPAAGDGSLLRDADIVLVPAVAIGLDGTRLGHGGGFYDRALTGVPTGRLVAVVHDDEVAATLPVEPHDVRVGWLCTPTRLQRLG